jgi:hypothetical protein
LSVKGGIGGKKRGEKAKKGADPGGGGRRAESDDVDNTASNTRRNEIQDKN